MKQFKILGLAVVAVAALMALAGAGTASATETTLCKVKETVGGLPQCAKANQYPAGTRIHAEIEANTTIVINTPAGKVECKKSTLEAVTEQQTAIPLGANVAAFNLAECNGIVQTVKQGTLDIEIIDLPEWTHNGTLTLTGTEITVEVAGLHCVYTPGDIGTLTGGAMATIDVLGNWPRTGGRSGALCGASATVEGGLTVTSPEPLWVSM
ncbi:MAG TPA: hypothetical protein VFX44_06815 [Solirubrobacterales bacterium]|nr:hypothetical protein [Solirubrobacterales bacterium]